MRLEVALLAFDQLLGIRQRLFAGLRLRPLLVRGSLELARRPVALADHCIPFTHRTFARREARLRLLMARLVRRALALKLALPLADFSELFRKLSSCLRPLTLGGFEFFDAALCVAGQFLDTCVLGNDLRVALDQCCLVALEIGELLLESLLPPVEVLRPARDLALPLCDCTSGLVLLVAG